MHQHIVVIFGLICYAQGTVVLVGLPALPNSKRPRCIIVVVLSGFFEVALSSQSTMAGHWCLHVNLCLYCIIRMTSNCCHPSFGCGVGLLRLSLATKLIVCSTRTCSDEVGCCCGGVVLVIRAGMKGREGPCEEW